MPDMANITVKAANGSTDVVYDKCTPSAGDSVPAIWRATAAGTSANTRPELRMTSQDVGQGSSFRRTRLTFRYPWSVTDANLGITTVKDYIQVNRDIVAPKGCPSAIVDEAVAQFANLNDSSLIVTSDQVGFAPT
ncbi:coat protein [ssRNA phage SRR6960799_23]|uniref:Coat protein n=1 Tax=ssRNA phage SRR6960799_23 TaxID=2786580 RepID=A0A8S5L4P5_9VIRU|nr:coat protein [ssRNA phage SRR6960799_23]DAD52319.1 TPA_asm: coat protein [ssRNA phage SRR6960799_23]